MELHGLLQTFPKYVKLFIASFVVVLSIGYSTGLLFVRQTQSVSPDGIEQNYLGNEDIENVKVMKFEKGAREMLTIIHTHILSMSFIFFFLGGLLAKSPPKKKNIKDIDKMWVWIMVSISRAPFSNFMTFTFSISSFPR